MPNKGSVAPAGMEWRAPHVKEFVFRIRFVRNTRYMPEGTSVIFFVIAEGRWWRRDFKAFGSGVVVSEINWWKSAKREHPIRAIPSSAALVLHWYEHIHVRYMWLFFGDAVVFDALLPCHAGPAVHHTAAAVSRTTYVAGPHARMS